MRIVVKVGTSTLTHKTGNLNIRRVELLCKVMSDIKNAGNEMILVTSCLLYTSQLFQQDRGQYGTRF